MDVEHLLSDINSHMPVSRPTLAECIDSGDLTYRTRSGHVCDITRDEIEKLKGICTEQEKLTLRLPMMLMSDTSFTESVWKAEGRTEVSVISKLLSKRPLRDDLIHLHYPHIRELTDILPNCVMVVFVP